MAANNERMLTIPFRVDDSEGMAKLINLIYENQVFPIITEDGEDARGAVLLAYNTSQAILKTILAVLLSDSSPARISSAGHIIKALEKAVKE